MNLNTLRDEAYRIARENGWHEEEHSNEHFLMLIITEIAEAVNADRSNRRAGRRIFEENANTPQPHPEKHWKFCYEQFIKGSLEEELADVVIRCLDLAGLRGIDLYQSEKELQHALFQIDPYTPKIKDFAAFAFRMVSYLVSADAYNPLRTKIGQIIITVFVFCSVEGIDLPWNIEQKMKYNRLRGYRHGGKNTEFHL